MREHKRWQIAVAFIFGLACVVGPILLVVISRALGAFKSTYYMYLALIALGVFSVARGFQFLSHNRRLLSLSVRGERISAQYVSHGTERQEGRMPVYYIRYTFTAGGRTYNAKSPAIYSWEQALAFRAAGEFDILFYNGDYTVATSGAVMYSEHFDRVQELKRAYNEAFYKVYAGGNASQGAPTHDSVDVSTGSRGEDVNVATCDDADGAADDNASDDGCKGCGASEDGIASVGAAELSDSGDSDN